MIDKIISSIDKGTPIYIRPYKEPKVWGIGGIGEYWYGAETGEKSSTAVVGEDTAPMADVLNSDLEKILGKEAIEKFGKMLPLVKILTPKNRLSVQFHDAKNELWIITGIDATIVGDNAEIILGFSKESVDEYKDKVAEKYGEALVVYGKSLNELIDVLEGDGQGVKVLKETKDARVAAEKVQEEVPGCSESLIILKKAREALEKFYNYRPVKVGDVVPVPSGTLHALGMGVEIIEPQIAGTTQSLEDGETYPVRYYFPGHKKSGVKKELDIDRVNEMIADVTPESSPEIIKSEGKYTIEKLPGNFEDKGLEVHRITMQENTKLEIPVVTSSHTLVAVNGKASVEISGKTYNIPKVFPGGEMLIIPVVAGSYSILSDSKVQIIDTFTPIE